MAVTGREARAERLNERLRGAQRTNVGDDSFNLDLGGIDVPGLDQPPVPPPVSSSPNSAKRRRLENGASLPVHNVPEQSSNRRHRSPRVTTTNDPYDLPNTSRESDVERAPRTAVFSSGGRLFPEQEEADLSVTRVIAALQVDPLGDEMDIASVSPRRRERQSRSTQRQQPRQREEVEEMVEESPSGKPGSGRRRRVQNSSALASAAKRRDAMLNSDNLDPAASSSPLAQKSRRSSVLPPARSMRTVQEVTHPTPSEEDRDNVDELSPERVKQTTMTQKKKSSAKPTQRTATTKTAIVSKASRPSPADEIDELSPSRNQEQSNAEEPVSSERTRGAQRPEPKQAQEPEDAQEIDEIEAAATLGKKRRRQGRPPTGSPDLGSKVPEAQPSPGPEERPAKRKRGRPSRSPVTQKQPVVKPRAKPATQKQRNTALAAKSPKTKAPKAARTATKNKDAPTARRRSSEDGENVAFEVTVQRFVNHKKRSKKSGAEHGSDQDSDGEVANEDTDPLQFEIPFANRTAESPVDVFAQLCEEVIGNMLIQFEEHLRNETDAARKKEVRVKIRAVEAYREELNLRLLQHAIHLNNWYTLRKRVRQAQKEKLALREEIIRLRTERAQVALRMDAVRIKHERETKEAGFLLDTSNIMRDIDQAVTQGREAPELPTKGRKEAELANLELIVAQVTDQVSSGSTGGGVLSQIQDFNAFLERAAVALESR